jgi:hypothetical protein
MGLIVELVLSRRETDTSLQVCQQINKYKKAGNTRNGSKPDQDLYSGYLKYISATKINFF